MIDAVIERCAGIDVGKKFILVCTLCGPSNEAPQIEIRTYGTTTHALQALERWLYELGCRRVVMESTSDYWKPIFNILEERMTVVLANPAHIKNIPGRKTDVKDCQWLAHLLRHGLVRSSFIPPRPIRELRDLTRRRRQLLSAATSERNRVQKVLEDAHIKLASILSDLFGVSGQDRLEALLAGNPDPEQIASLARCRLRRRVPAIKAAVEQHRLRDHHRFLLRQFIAHIGFLEEQILELDRQIMEMLQPYQQGFDLLQTIPGIRRDAAAILIAEIGPDMSQFPTPEHLAAWAGVCPGNNESAGKRKSAHVRKRNRWLRGILTQSAWGATRKGNSYFKHRYARLAARRGSKRAVIAIARILLLTVYHVLSKRVPYRDLGPNYLDERQRNRHIRYHLRRLAEFGITIPPHHLPPSPATSAPN